MEDQRWSERTKQWVIVAALVLVALAFYRFQRILTPVIVAVILAYVLNPIVSFFQRRLGISRGLSVVLIFLLLIALISLIPILVVPALVQQVENLNLNIQEMLDFFVGLFRGPIVIGGITIPTTQLYDRLVASIETWVSSLAASSVNILVNLASGVAWTVIVLVLSFWIVKDAPALRRGIVDAAPLPYRRDLRLLGQEIVRVWHGFFRGQLVLILVVGAAVAVALSAVGLPYALLMGLIAGILELVPNIGPVLAAVPAIVIALTRGSTFLPLSPLGFALLVAGIYVLIQQVENNLLVPRIMGQSLNLHPLVVLIGILLGATLAGVLGIFLAAPVLATLRVLARYVYRRLTDREPFPEDETRKISQELAPPLGRLDREPIQAVLFDLDGTLIDTDDAVIIAWARRLRFIDWLFPNRRPEAFLRKMIMHGENWANWVLAILDRLHLDRAIFGVREWWLRVSKAKRAPFLPMEGAAELLDALDGKYRLGIVTTRNRADTMAFLQQIGRADLIETIITRDSVKRLKPHPEPILKAAKGMGLSPEQLVMVGDTSLDVRAARAGGAQSVGVLCGLGLLDDLLQADLVLCETRELAAYLLD